MESTLRNAHRSLAKASLAQLAVVYDDMVKQHGVPKNGEEMLSMMTSEIFQDETDPDVIKTPEKPKKITAAPAAPRKRSPSTSSDDMSVESNASEKKRGRPKKVLSAEEQAAKDAKAKAAAEKKAASEFKKKEKMDAMKAEINSLITNFEQPGTGKRAAIKTMMSDAKTIGDLKEAMKMAKKEISIEKKAKKEAEKAESSDDDSVKKSRGRPKKVLSAEEQAAKDALAAEKAAKKQARAEKKAAAEKKKAETAAAKAEKQSKKDNKDTITTSPTKEAEEWFATNVQNSEVVAAAPAEEKPTVFVSVVKTEEELAQQVEEGEIPDDVSAISEDSNAGEKSTQNNMEIGDYLFINPSDGLFDELEFCSLFKQKSSGKYYGTDEDNSVYEITMDTSSGEPRFPNKINMDNIELVGSWDTDQNRIEFEDEEE
mgnify:CR=1 FL=1